MKKMLLSLVAAASACGAQALTLPNIFSNNMMLQQQTQANVWGWAEPGSKVEVQTSWNQQKYTVRTGTDGRWSLKINTPQASYDTYSMTIKGDGETRQIGNILVGEVWFCSGQSNMEMPLGGFWNCPVEGANETIAQSGKYIRSIRVATVEHKDALTPQKDVPVRWDVCSPKAASSFSACGYYFAQTLTDLLDVPVGIINCSWGGSCVEGWMPREILETYPDGLTPCDDTDYHRKMVMYNGMLRPLAGYNVKGFLWNQGESNVGREQEYIDRFQTMTNLWRYLWDNPAAPEGNLLANAEEAAKGACPALPMYTVELPPYWYDNNDGDWGAKFREAQHSIAHRLVNSGCVCTNDLVYSHEEQQIHGSKKKEIGQRLAYMAAKHNYNVEGALEGLSADAPEFQRIELDVTDPHELSVVAGSAVANSPVLKAKGDGALPKVYRLYFSNAQDGFDRMKDIEGFEVAGSDGKWHPAIVWSSSEWQNTATPGCFLKLCCPEIEDVVYVRYNFKNWAPGRLHNMRGLPVVPFTTEGKYVSVRDGRFYQGEREYRYVGANMWYGAILGSEGEGGNRPRLVQELDDMQRAGIDNVRVLIGGQKGVKAGLRDFVIQPLLELEPGVYNDTILQGLDFLMAELEKRQMKAVLYFNNAWEWSGGYSAYLEWAGAGEAPSPRVWKDFSRYNGSFLTNKKAREMAANTVRTIVSRVNTVTGRPYSESPALMTWEVANEPRCFIDDEEHKAAFVDWIGETARLIKSLDPNHLVTTGSEGPWGCENDMNLFRDIHSIPEVDYACIHVWPFNWSWLGKYVATAKEAVTTNGPASVVEGVERSCENTLKYIDAAYAVMQPIGRPMVLEEFGYPRDGYLIAATTPTSGRDAYYKYVFSIIRDSGKIAGCNFWSWGGRADVKHESWQKGDDYTGDPAQEEQGLNSVFSTDASTMKIIREMTQQIRR